MFDDPLSEKQKAAVEDLQEIEVMSFLFNTDFQNVMFDPCQMQTMLMERKIQKRVVERVWDRLRNDGDLVANIANSHPPQPTAATTIQSPQTQPIDYSKAKRKSDDFEVTNRCDFISMRNEKKRVIPAPIASPMTPTPSPVQNHEISDHSDVESSSDKTLSELRLSPSVQSWSGSSIFNNLPGVVMNEFDKMLKDTHNLKVEVIETLNHESPVNYEYNPKKSRIRTNYADPRIADDRTRNNIASRRSRQRKKFQTQIVQYSVDYDVDENFLIKKQVQWLKGIISNLEQKHLANNAENGVDELKAMRKRCGLV